MDTAARRCTTRAGAVVEEGTVISVDGSAGTVYAGAVPLVASEAMRYLETGEQCDGVVAAVAGALEQADSVRRLEVRANAETPRTRGAPAGSGRRASGCAAPSTCSSASAASWSRT